MSNASTPATVADDHGHGGHVEHYDPVGNKQGFWLFLFTEVFLFGMFFIAFAIYLRQYRAEFQASSGLLDVTLGGINTLVLLTSSLTMALAIAVLQRGKKMASIWLRVIALNNE